MHALCRRSSAKELTSSCVVGLCVQVVDVPRLRLTPSESAGDFTFEDFLDMFNGDTCTCLYNCELDTNWNQVSPVFFFYYFCCYYFKSL